MPNGATGAGRECFAGAVASLSSEPIRALRPATVSSQVPQACIQLQGTIRWPVGCQDSCKNLQFERFQVYSLRRSLEPREGPVVRWVQLMKALGRDVRPS